VIAAGSLAAGTVTGGAGKSGGTSGTAYGSGIFIQGTDDLTLAPGAGQTLTIGGVIADMAGSGGTATALGALVIDGAGTVDLTVKNTFAGGITLGGGALVLGGTGAAGAGTITFAYDPSLEFTVANTPTNVVADFFPGATIDVLGFSATSSAYVSNVLTLTGSGGPVKLDIPGKALSNFVVTDAIINGTSVAVVTSSPTVVVTASTDVELNADILQADTLSQGTSVDYTINLTGNVTLTSDLAGESHLEFA